MESDIGETQHPIADTVLSGFGAGTVLIAAQMLISAALGGPPSGPLRLISSIVLGRQALDPSYPFAGAVSVGLVIHLALSIVFALLFLFLVIIMGRITAAHQLIVLGFCYGILLWLINFYLIGRTVFPQFLETNQFWNGFIAHALFYGVPLGWCMTEGHMLPPLKREISGSRRRSSFRTDRNPMEHASNRH
ncbi:MAG TPA: hypothetical protein VIB79_13380 [Candidatus Binatia bacterium]|jgi:hypothetical protein